MPVTRPAVQQPRIEELTPSLSRLVLYLGIPLALIAIVFVITAIALFPTTSDAYVPYSSIAFMASLITVAAALIISFIAMYQIAMGLDRRFEYLVRMMRQQSSTTQAVATATPTTPQYLPQPQQGPERILAPAPRPPQVKPQQVQQPQQQTAQEEGIGEEQQQQEGTEEGLSEE
ncbi:hypothetical protein JCM16161A_02780 [Vulcanisaeta sp. JCM 16161]